MQTAIALTFLNVVAEEEISLDELVIVLRQVMEAEGLPGFLQLLLQVLDELWAIKATGQGKVPGMRCCEHPSYEIKDRVQRRIRTAAGKVEFFWRRLRCRHCHRQVIPMRHWLGLKRWQSKTGELEQVVTEVISEQSYRRGSRHLQLVGQIPVPKSTAHRWVVESPCDELAWPKSKLVSLMADGTGYKRRPEPEKKQDNKGELRVVIGFDKAGQAVPLGTWSGKSWEEIGQDLKGASPRLPLAEQLTCDGEPGLAEALSGVVNRVQRCQWHMVHDLDRLMWFDQAPLAERRQRQKQLSGMLAIELPAHEYEPVREKDQQQCRQRVDQAQGELERLAGLLAEKGYHQASTYVALATKRLFTYVRFWLKTGIVAAKTTSLLERLMRELGRRLKRIAFGWSQTGAAKMARILIKKICDPQQWEDYWKKRLGITGKVLIQFRGGKVVTL